jgi:hypothetical protein
MPMTFCKRWYWEIMGNPPSRVLHWWHWVLTHPKSIWGKPSETSFFVVLEVTSQSVVQIRIHIPLGPKKGYSMLQLLYQNVLKEHLRCPVSWPDILPFSNQPFTCRVFENASAISSARYFFLAIPHKDSETRPKHCGWIISNNNPCVLVVKPLTKMVLWWHIYNDTIIMIIIIINNSKYNNIKSVYIVFTSKTKSAVKICIFEILRVLEHGPLPASQIRPIRPTHWLFDYAAAGTWWNRGADGIASLVYPKKYLSP